MQKLRWRIAQFFEKFWWKGYLKRKSSNKYLIWKKEYWYNFLNKINLKQSDLNVPIIDIGCGPSGIFCIFKNKNITALDPLLSDYDELEIFDRAAYPNVKFKESSFENFQVQEKFKTIFCLNAINHFIDMDASFRKINKICDQNGQLILSVDVHNYSLFRKLFTLFPLDILHPHQYNLEEYKTFLIQNGFEIESSLPLKKAFFFNYWVLIANKK